MPLGTTVGLGPGHIVFDGDPAPQKGPQPHNFRPVSIVAKRSPISATAEHLYYFVNIVLVFYFVTSCDCQLIIKENDDDDDDRVSGLLCQLCSLCTQTSQMAASQWT